MTKNLRSKPRPRGRYKDPFKSNPDAKTAWVWNGKDWSKRPNPPTGAKP